MSPCPHPTRRMTRRSLLTGLAATLPVLATPLWAGQVIDLEWADLIPDGGGTAMSRLRDLGVVQHGDISSIPEQDTSVAVTDAYNGKTVRLPGYVVPLDYGADGVTSFILVPYVGACIHVPPPPPNQLVIVETDPPWPTTDLWDAVWVSGIMTAAPRSSEVAEAGYTIVADRIERFD